MGNDEELSKKINTNNRKIWDQEDHDEDDYFRPEYGTIHMPWLNIQLSDDGSTGVITGHEGRHRASALIKVGNNKIQVVLIMRAGKDMLTGKYNKEYHLTSDHIPTMVKNQYNDAYYSTTDWQVKKDDMQQNSRR